MDTTNGQYIHVHLDDGTHSPVCNDPYNPYNDALTSVPRDVTCIACMDAIQDALHCYIHNPREDE